jgi:hypothetical protein
LDLEIAEMDRRPAASILARACALITACQEILYYLARPGGWVASLEPDGEHSIYYLHHEVLDRMRELFMVAFSRNGADPLIGRRLGELYRQAGLEDVGLEARAAELDSLDKIAREYLANPDVVAMPNLTFLVWGRKPTVG